ncbi:hypothetical protein COCCADRAFT_100773, partial [Bipolaris zeicola 26-R-13]
PPVANPSAATVWSTSADFPSTCISNLPLTPVNIAHLYLSSLCTYVRIHML